MKVAICLQEKNHLSFLQEIINTLPSLTEITIYTTNFHKNNLYINSHQIKFRNYSLIKLFIDSNKYDKIIIDEINNIHLFELAIFIPFAKKMYLVIHNLKSWFRPNMKIKFRNILVSIYRLILTKIFSNYIVVGNNLKKWGFDNSSNKNRFYFIPFGFNEHYKLFIEDKKEKIINIVIPGMICKRRSYENIVNIIKHFQYSKNIYFVFLGKAFDAYGKSILKEVEILDNVKVYYNYIEPEEYEKQLVKSDYIFADFLPQYKTMFQQEEIYGLTKETGIIYLSMIYNKPLILPSHYLGMQEIDSQILRFTDYTSILNLFHKLINTPELSNSLYRKAKENKIAVKKIIDNI